MAERDFNLQMTGEQVKDALQQLEDRVAEGWAVGEHDGVPVTSGSPYYHNNSAWWAQQAGLSATAAASSAATAEQEVEEGIRQGIVGAYVQESATPGAIVTIDDGADNIPLKDLKVNLAINQPGTGDPSPTNVRPIYPVTEAEVSRTAINIWDEETQLGRWDNSGAFNPAFTSYLACKNLIAVKPSTEYYFCIGSAVNTARYIRYYDENGAFISSEPDFYANKAFTTPANCQYITFGMGSGYGATYNHDISINYPTTETAYHSGAGNQQHLVNIGINQWDEDWEVGTINNDTGVPEADANNIRSKNFCPCIAGTQYNIVSKDSKVLRYYFYDKDETFISGGATSGTNTIVTAPTGACYFKVRTTSSYGSTYLSDISVNFPSRFTDYYAYTGHIVYGGDADITPGILTAKYVAADLGTRTWYYNSTNNYFYTEIGDMYSGYGWDSNITDILTTVYPYKGSTSGWAAMADKTFGVAGISLRIKDTQYNGIPTDFRDSLIGQYVVYPLATPISIQLDPTEVDTLRGDNVIWADCGDITNCEYRADLKMYIDKVVGA